MQTEYPWSDTVEFTIKAQAKSRMKLRLCIPGWVKEPYSLQVNDQEVADCELQSGYAVLDREWQDGDRARLGLRMSFGTEALQSNHPYKALLYGPLVLAGLVSRAAGWSIPKSYPK
jgi:uncharacterized protein